MTRILAATWRWSWLVSLPLTVLGLFWLPPVWRDARQFLVWHPASLHRSSDVDLDLGRLLRARLASLRVDFAGSWRARWAPLTGPLRTVELKVDPARLAQLNANLPRSGKQDLVPGLMRYPDGGFERVGVRYRGDSIHHWGLAARSWLVRTGRERLLDGRRRWHLVLPRWRSVGNYHVNLRIAARMGVLAADAEPVNLRVNGRQHGGIHLLQPQQDESFVRLHRRLPSDLYVGDMTPLDDNFVNEAPVGGLWELPWLWQKAALSHPDAAESRLPLEILLFRLHRGTDAELLEMLDLPAWATFSAYMQLFAASHMDMGHNWRLLFDPGRLRFEPVVGDGNGLPDNVLDLTEGRPARDASITTPLLARLHRNHRFLRLKAEAVERFFRDGLDRAYFEELDAMVRNFAPTLRIHPQLDWIGTVDGGDLRYFDDQDLTARAQAVEPRLRRWFEEQRGSLTPSPDHVRAAALDGGTLRVQVDGHAPFRLGLRPPPGVRPTGAVMRVLRSDGREEEADVTGLLRVDHDILWLDWPLLAQRSIATPTHEHPRADHRVGPATYDLVLRGVDARAVELRLADGTREGLPVPRATALPAIPVARDNEDVLPSNPAPLRWAGDVTVTGVTEIERAIEIDPGTRIRLAPGASLILRGRVSARGEEGRPIRFERLAADAAWGTVAVVGRSADGSVFEHCVFVGGSGRATPLSLFSGMVTFRDVHGLRVDRCEFRENSASDDLLHAAYCDLRISDSLFRDARRDGIDLDRCTGRLDGVVVAGAGDDALELTASDVVLARSLLRDAGARGLAAADGSNVVVIDSVLADHAIGLQATDAGEALLYNATLRDNRVALAARHQDPLFPDRVRITLARSRVDGPGQTLDLRDGSELVAWGSAGRGLPAPRTGAADETSADGRAAPTPAFGRLIPGDHWRLADPSRLGATERLESQGNR